MDFNSCLLTLHMPYSFLQFCQQSLLTQTLLESLFLFSWRIPHCWCELFFTQSWIQIWNAIFSVLSPGATSPLCSLSDPENRGKSSEVLGRTHNLRLGRSQAQLTRCLLFNLRGKGWTENQIKEGGRQSQGQGRPWTDHGQLCGSKIWLLPFPSLLGDSAINHYLINVSSDKLINLFELEFAHL